MTTSTFPNSGHVALAKVAKSLTFLFALSRGDPAWDSMWAGQNPPTPSIEATNVLDVFGYARPIRQEFVKDDPNGTIVATGGGKFSYSDTPTRLLLIRLNLPVSAYQGNQLREIGIFSSPSIDPTVPPGDVVIPANRVSNPGDLFHLHWRPAYDLEDGDSFSRNFLLRL